MLLQAVGNVAKGLQGVANGRQHHQRVCRELQRVDNNSGSMGGQQTD